MDLTKVLRDADLDERVVYSRELGAVKVAAVTGEDIGCVRTGGLYRWDKEGRLNGEGGQDLYPNKNLDDWEERRDLPEGTEVIVNDGRDDNWMYRVYAGGGQTFAADERKNVREQWAHIISVSSFRYAERRELSGGEEDYGEAL